MDLDNNVKVCKCALSKVANWKENWRIESPMQSHTGITLSESSRFGNLEPIVYRQSRLSISLKFPWKYFGILIQAQFRKELKLF